MINVSKPMSLRAQVRLAKLSIREVKERAPWLYGEYQELMSARKNLEAAQQRLKEATEAWTALGK